MKSTINLIRNQSIVNGCGCADGDNIDNKQLIENGLNLQLHFLIYENG